MTISTINIIKTFFSGVYNLFTGFYIPGTSLTPLGLSLGIFGTLFIIHTIKSIFGDSLGVHFDKSNNPNRYNSSSDRRYDTK